MKEGNMTVDEAYRELKGDITGLRTEFKSDMSRMRTWVISLFIGAVIIIGTLVGVYANRAIALWMALPK